MRDFRAKIQRHPLAAWSLTLAYLVFAGCFHFPLRLPAEYASFLSWVVLTLFPPLLLGLLFAGLLPRGVLKVAAVSLACLALGMLLRYALEYGEVSNTCNFTPLNMALYLILVPLSVTAVYLVASRLAEQGSPN